MPTHTDPSATALQVRTDDTVQQVERSNSEHRWKSSLAYAGFLCSIGAVVYLIAHIGPGRLATVLVTASPPLLGLGAVTALAGWAVATSKWRAVLRALGVERPVLLLFRLTLASQLWGIVLPVPFSDELFRSGRLATTEVRLSTMAGAATIDRLSTLLATAMVGLIAGVLERSGAANQSLLIAALALVVAPGIGFTLLHQQPFFDLVVVSAGRILPASKAKEIETAASWLLRRPVTLIRFLALAIALQLVFIAAMTVWTRAFGLQFPVVSVAWAMMAAALLPYLTPLPGVSLLVQQGSFVYLLVKLGASPAQAGAVALSSLALSIVFGAVGVLWETACALAGSGRRPLLAIPTASRKPKRRLHW